MKKSIIIAFAFLTSCSSGQIKFSPEGVDLKNAKVGTFYQQVAVLTFKESGDVISLNPSNFRAKVTPENSGLDIEPNFDGCENFNSEKCGDYNHILIKGVPKMKGVITVEVAAKTYASMYSKSQLFVKKYQIFVE